MNKADLKTQLEEKLRQTATSNDVAVGLEQAKSFIQIVISSEEFTEKEIVEFVKKVLKHFNLEDKSKDDFIKFAQDLTNVYKKNREEKAYQNDILKNGTSRIKVDRIFPAIDYRESLGMIYAIRGYDDIGKAKTYIGTGKGKIYEINRAKEFGLIPTHEEKIDTRLNINTYADYLENGKTVKASLLFTRIKDFLKKFIVVADDFYYVLVSYILMTYIYVLFQVIPYLWLNGERGTGKSTIMKLLNKLCFNPLYCSNITPANIFRQIDNDGSTIILDEFEKMYGEDKQEIIKLLNQGFNKDAVVSRCVGQNNQVKKFRSFSPKIMGGISNIDDVLFERCIKYTTEKVKGVKITKFRETKEQKEEIDNIVQDLYIFGYTYAEKIKKIYDNEEIEYKGNNLREDDLWNPLLCIAKIIDDEDSSIQVTDKLLEYAKKLSEEKFKRFIENEPKIQILYYLNEYIDAPKSQLTTFINGIDGYQIYDIRDFLVQKCGLDWIKSSSFLGKFLTQTYGFKKKRIMVSDNKCTFYFFNRDMIIQKLKDEGVDISDFG